jgi:hypothetical protein
VRHPAQPQARNHETAKAADIAPPAVADTIEETHEVTLLIADMARP